MSTITTRAGKGSPLTNTEVDDNFTNLNTDKLESIENESLADLSNVSSTTPTDGQVLAFNTTAGSWEPQDASGGASELNDLSDASTGGGTGNLFLLANASSVTSGAIFNTIVGGGTKSLTEGDANVIVGYGAGSQITTGYRNVAVGYQTMGSSNNAAVENCIALGYRSLYNVNDGGVFTDGNFNIGIGYRAGDNITTGYENIVLGKDADASSATVNGEITLGGTTQTRFRLPGVQSGASDGDVMTYNATDGIIELTASSGGLSQGKAIVLAMVFG